ncbi:hypothetical protein [Pontibacter sp. SGAir0037]|uniref:hypothetical protein n=1 Tax=Pontibacter sp. SGAir0037 TaxID=2571030 RepID=UPI001F10CC06|nr:hypothetical protein [Pontibacter sp. SGAir0037]
MKFFGGPLAGISFGLSYLETALLTIAGMMSSVVVFSFVGRAFFRWYSKYRTEKKKPVFSKKNRMVVKVWSSFGIPGIAFLTPLLLTPIFGTVIAAVLGVPKKRIILHMLWSAVFWGFVLTYMAFEFKHLAEGIF